MTAAPPINGEGSLLRLYTLVQDRLNGQPLEDALLTEAHSAGLAGVTVLRGPAGFGRHGFDTELDLSEYHPDHQPVVFELVDSEARLLSFLDLLTAKGLPDRLVTLERAEVLAYRSGEALNP